MPVLRSLLDGSCGSHSSCRRGVGGIWRGYFFQLRAFTELRHHLLLGAVDSGLDLEVVGSRLAVLVEVALGLESEAAGVTGIGSLVGVGSYVLV